MWKILLLALALSGGLLLVDHRLGAAAVLITIIAAFVALVFRDTADQPRRSP